MVTRRITLTKDPYHPAGGTNLELMVAEMLTNWHLEDGFQEEINMRLRAGGIPAGVVKVGGPIDTFAFQVVPYSNPPYNPYTNLRKRY